MNQRRRIRVTGIVQGVGFRPFVHRLAMELGLVGFVGNDDSGVFIEAEGSEQSLDDFCRRLSAQAPALAVVREVTWQPMPPTGAVGFSVAPSAHHGEERTAIPPDVATCAACRHELFDPSDRRHRYPFTNCTDCGPRLSVITDLPYDRATTTMAGFPLCAACAAEYADITDRRYHAEPTACPQCGPQISWRQGDHVLTGTDSVIAAFQQAIAAGQVVAVKSVGGFHLAVDATDPDAVARLRERKQRADKPLAVMVPDVQTASRIAQVDAAEAAILASPAAPIVLLPRRTGSGLADNIAPRNPLVGLLLPYSPLHHLLFAVVPGASVRPPTMLVLTSGNLSDEPICHDNDEALARLGGIADAFLLHDRPIAVPVDDSVVRVLDGEVQPVRRSRGYAPVPVELPVEVSPVLAVGGEMKNTFCVASGRRAWVSQHVGDMENLETLHAFERGVADALHMYRVQPASIAIDPHPGYLTSQWGRAHRSSADVVEVQHHHAHVAAVMAEHGLDGSQPVIGVAFDGTGYGVDGDGGPQLWGGEVLLADYRGFRRVAHLLPLPLPGGDAAVRHPCRTAVAWLTACGLPTGADPSSAACDDVELDVVRRQVQTGAGVAPTTSMGRLFDVAASLLDVRHRISYEAQAAIELEALARVGDPSRAPLPSFDIGSDLVADPAPVLAALVHLRNDGRAVADLAAAFHAVVADLVLAWVQRLLATHGPLSVALTGGVFQNEVLLREVRGRLATIDIVPLTHRLVPPNDGGLALGQAVIAGIARQGGN